MEIAHVRGRVVREVRAYFLARHDAADVRGFGEELATRGTRFDLDVDGRIIAIELARDAESHNRGNYVGPFRDAAPDWDSSFPFETSPTGSDEDEVRSTSFHYRAGDELDVWGEVIETELVAAGYRDAPSKNPTVLRARAIDVPVGTPPILTSWRIGSLLLLAAIVAVAAVPMGRVTPFARFWCLLALSLATSRAHWKLVPNATSSAIWSSWIPSLLLMYAHIGLVLTMVTPLVPAVPSWMTVVASALIGGHAFASLVVRWSRMRRLRTVAHLLARGRELGIVREVSKRWVDSTSEVTGHDTVVVVLEHEERTIALRDIVFDSHMGCGPRPGSRVLLGNGALYASWADPRAELDHILLWDGRLRWIGAAFCVVLPIITYLAYQAPRLAG